MYSFLAEPDDNLANYECRAQNREGHEPQKKAIHVKVACGIKSLDAPQGVDLFGETSIRQGATTSVQCRSKPSNPVSRISWLLNGHPIPATIQSEHKQAQGTVSISNLTINSNEVLTIKHWITVECTARNDEGAISKQHVIKILAPPMTPRITGLEEGVHFEGDILNLTCEAHGGNPLADIGWFRGYEKLTGARSSVSGDSTISSLSIMLDRTMNGQRLKCEATNEALDEPVIDSKQLSILFPPRRVLIRTPEGVRYQLMAGKEARLLCAAPASNPPANIVWYFYPNGERNPLIYTGETVLNETSRDSGHTVENAVTFTPSEAYDGTLVRCIASHPLWPSSKNVTFPLNVYCKFKSSLLVNTRHHYKCLICGRARARCRVIAVPDADFVWDRAGEFIKGNNSKYVITTIQLDYSTFESTLWIHNISPDDYSKEIRCTARNNFGADSVRVPVGPLSPPDVPLDVRMINATSNTISITWTPGFDGGLDQIFEVRYQKDNEDAVHGVNTSHTHLRLSGLSPAKIYHFQIRAINSRGFSSDLTRPASSFATLNEEGVDVAFVSGKKDTIPRHIIMLFIVGGLFLVFFNFILLCYMHRRNRRKKIQEKTEMVRTAINGDGVRPVQMYGTMLQAEGPSHCDRDERDIPEASEDDHSVRTMIVSTFSSQYFPRSTKFNTVIHFMRHFNNNNNNNNSNNRNSPQHLLSTFIQPNGVHSLDSSVLLEDFITVISSESRIDLKEKNVNGSIWSGRSTLSFDSYDTFVNCSAQMAESFFNIQNNTVVYAQAVNSYFFMKTNRTIDGQSFIAHDLYENTNMSIEDDGLRVQAVGGRQIGVDIHTWERSVKKKMGLASNMLPSGDKELVLSAIAPLYNIRVCFLSAMIYVEFEDKVMQIKPDYKSVEIFTDKYTLNVKTNMSPYDASVLKVIFSSSLQRIH
uniref:Nephrin n=1 Tax=Heterorhabditis bacteriophora TaxID=37862 RepID=A0A1I7WLD7_HETBA